MNEKTLKELKGIDISPKEYFDAKKIVEKYEIQPKYDKKFYVQRAFGFYSVGTFYGWDNDNIMLKLEDNRYISTPIEYVFEDKQEGMDKLNK